MPTSTTLPGLGPTTFATIDHSPSGALLARYRWFLQQLAGKTPRTIDELERVLSRPPSAPGIHELAMAELSISSYDPRANIILSMHAPSPRTREFHLTCVAICAG
ncbi:MAG: hypothetical protein VYE40_17345 [Myxococcota bacterium]|jgi:hypothetical protein|nr:hypothetical protein [Myxococcota bacterium]